MIELFFEFMAQFCPAESLNYGKSFAKIFRKIPADIPAKFRNCAGAGAGIGANLPGPGPGPGFLSSICRGRGREKMANPGSNRGRGRDPGRSLLPSIFRTFNDAVIVFLY